MSETIVEVDTHTGSVVVPQDGEGVTAASLKTAVQALANRTKHAFDHGVGIASGSYDDNLDFNGVIQFFGGLVAYLFSLANGEGTETIAANTNNWNPGSHAAQAVLRTELDSGSYNLTGLVAKAGGSIRLLLNIGGGSLTLKHESASSTAANRFLCPNNADVVVRPNGAVLLWYDADTTGGSAPGARWRVIAP